MTRKMTRRAALGIFGVGAGALALSACDVFSTDPADAETPGTPGTPGALQDKEAPSLAARVKSGDLPPLEERIPVNPFQQQTLETNGLYGGKIRRSVPGSTAGPVAGARDGLVIWDPMTLEAVPGVAESVEASSDASTYTFTLREGIKWSDGTPITTADVEFAYQQILMNTTLTPTPPVWLVVGDEVAKLNIVDDLTFELQFAGTAGLLPRFLAYDGNRLLAPVHYLEQFHPEFADQAQLNAQAERDGYDTWDAQFAAKSSWWQNTELPTLYPWIISKPMGASGTHAEAVRNPFYWKVDSDGRQLPYVDTITYDVLDPNAAALRAANGELDLQAKYLALDSLPVLVKNQEKNGYKVSNWGYEAAWIAIHLNQTSKDPVLGPLLRELDFRAALSHGINRDDINKSVYSGAGGTDQPVPIPQDPYHVDGAGKTFVEFDVAKANSLLDGLGLDRRDDQGMRLSASGERIRLVLETFEFNVQSTDVYNFVVRYWKDLGLDTTLKSEDAALWSTHATNGDISVAGYPQSGFLWDIDPLWWVPTDPATYWAPLYGTYYASGGTAGQEPTGIFKQLQDWYDELRSSADESARKELGQQIVKAHDENVWVVGTVSQPFLPLIHNADLVNVSPDRVFSYKTADEEATILEQLAYKDPSKHE